MEQPETLTEDERWAKLVDLADTLDPPRLVPNRAEKRARARAAKKKRGQERARLHQAADRYANKEQAADDAAARRRSARSK